MSPEEHAARLAEEIRAEIARIDKVAGDLATDAQALGPDCPRVIRLAVAAGLHSFYTGCEVTLVRIARAFGTMPAGPDWHVQLLTQTAAGIEGVRPPILSPPTAADLFELLRFRHFFRLSYGVEFVPEKLAAEVERVARVRARFREEIESLIGLIESRVR